jgi:hypothetical protein
MEQWFSFEVTSAVEGSNMKKHHLFAYYCTLLVPVGALAGLGVGQVIGGSAILALVGLILGFAASALLLGRTGHNEIP